MDGAAGQGNGCACAISGGSDRCARNSESGGVGKYLRHNTTASNPQVGVCVQAQLLHDTYINAVNY